MSPWTDEQIREAGHLLREREQARRTEMERRRGSAREEARRVAAMLAERFAVRRVYLFGSAAGWWSFHEESDIDLAVEGLTADGEHEARRAAEDSTRGFAVDVHRLDALDERLVRKVREEGAVLYDREGLS